MTTARSAAATKSDDAGEEPIADRLRVVISHLFRRLEQRTRDGSLTSTESAVLATTKRLGPIGISELARHEAMNPTMLSRVLGRLEEAGLIVRTTDPSDRRAASVEMTAAGRRQLQRVRAERSAVLAGLLAGVSGDDEAALAAALPVLEQLAEALKDRP